MIITLYINSCSYPAAGSHPLLVEYVPPTALHQITLCSSGRSRLHSCQQRLLLWHCVQVRSNSGGDIKDHSGAFSSFSPLPTTLCIVLPNIQHILYILMSPLAGSHWFQFYISMQSLSPLYFVVNVTLLVHANAVSSTLSPFLKTTRCWSGNTNVRI